MNTCTYSIPFSSSNDSISRKGYYRGMGTVIRSKYNQRFFSQSQAFNMGADATDNLIRIGYHFFKITGIILIAKRAICPIFRIRRRNKGVVNENHGIIHEKRLVLMLGNKIQNIIAENIRTIGILTRSEDFSIRFHQRIRIALSFGSVLSELPQTIMIKTKIIDPIREVPIGNNIRISESI